MREEEGKEEKEERKEKKEKRGKTRVCQLGRTERERSVVWQKRE